jgi:hypothetical protein
MPNYQNSKIYKLTSPYTDKIYIGSTVRPLDKRLEQHRCQYYGGSTITSWKLFQLAPDDVKIELLCSYPCNNKEEAAKLERWFIEENIDRCVNKCLPIISLEEKKQYQKKYRESHREYFKNYSKKYRVENPEYFKNWHLKKKNNCHMG